MIYCIGYSVIKDTVSSHCTKYTMCTALNCSHCYTALTVPTISMLLTLLHYFHCLHCLHCFHCLNSQTANTLVTLFMQWDICLYKLLYSWRAMVWGFSGFGVKRRSALDERTDGVGTPLNDCHDEKSTCSANDWLNKIEDSSSWSFSSVSGRLIECTERKLDCKTKRTIWLRGLERSSEDQVGMQAMCSKAKH